MENNNDITWDKLIAEGKYLRSIGAPVDDQRQLAEWIKTYRQVLAMPDEQVGNIVQRAVQAAIRQVESGDHADPSPDDAGGILELPPPPNASEPLAWNGCGLQLAAQDAASNETLVADEAQTVGASAYKLKDEDGGVFALATDREGYVFVLLPDHMLTRVPRGIHIEDRIYDLKGPVEHGFEVVDLGEGDLTDLADNQFVVTGKWQW